MSSPSTVVIFSTVIGLESSLLNSSFFPLLQTWQRDGIDFIANEIDELNEEKSRHDDVDDDDDDNDDDDGNYVKFSETQYFFT